MTYWGNKDSKSQWNRNKSDSFLACKIKCYHIELMIWSCKCFGASYKFSWYGGRAGTALNSWLKCVTVSLFFIGRVRGLLKSQGCPLVCSGCPCFTWFPVLDTSWCVLISIELFPLGLCTWKLKSKSELSSFVQKTVFGLSNSCVFFWKYEESCYKVVWFIRFKIWHDLYLDCLSFYIWFA